MRDREIKQKVNKKVKNILGGKSVEGGKIGKKTGLTGGKKSTVGNKKSDQVSQLRVQKKPGIKPVEGKKEWECNFCEYSGQEDNPLDDDLWIACKCDMKYHVTCANSLKLCFCIEQFV